MSIDNTRATARENQSLDFTTRSDINWVGQPQKMARSLEFYIEEQVLYYPCSENKGADQLCIYLRL